MTPELFRFFLTTFKSDLGESQRQADPTYSRLDEDAKNLLHDDAAIPHLDAELTALLPLLPSCAGRPLLDY